MIQKEKRKPTPPKYVAVKNTCRHCGEEVEIIIHCLDVSNNYLISYNTSTKYLPNNEIWNFNYVIDFWHIKEPLEEDAIGIVRSFVNSITIEIKAK